MRTRYASTPLADLLEDSLDGEWGEKESQTGLQQCLVIRGTDFDSVRKPNADFPNRWISHSKVQRKRLQPNDIIFEMAGGTATQSTGRSAFLPKSFFQKHSEPILCASFCRHLRIKTTYEPRYIYYYLQQLYKSGYIPVFNTQHTGVSRFQYTTFKNHTSLFIPDISAQRKIAAILSAYDDLIEVNERRIALLERMAEELYREWFVKMRFPGSCNSAGDLPDGWEKTLLPEVASITYGFPFDGSRFNSEGIGKPIIRIRNIPDSHTDDYTDEIADPRYIIRSGDFLIGMDGEFHMNHWVGSEAYLVQRSCRITPNKALHRAYLAQALKEPIKSLEATIQGATVGHLGAKHLNAISIILPDESMNEKLSQLNQLLDQQIRIRETIAVLAATRDRFLSRLMSGVLDVEDLDIAFPPSMEEELAVSKG